MSVANGPTQSVVEAGGVDDDFPIVHRADGVLQPAAPHHYRDGQLARPLRDGDDVDVRARNRREDTARQARMTLHAFADSRQQFAMVTDLTLRAKERLRAMGVTFARAPYAEAGK